MSTRRDFVKQSTALAVLAAGLSPQARAQSLQMARIICGFPAGGTSDAMSRRLADKLRGNYAANVVVENKPGAGGQIGVTTVKDSPADGSTMLLTPSSMLSLYPYVYKSLPYKPLEDVQPASLACYFNHAFGVGPAVPQSVKTLKDFVAWAKANPEKANYGSPGAGSMPHLIGALMNKFAGVELKHVPYRGSVPGVTDLVGGQIAAMVTPSGDFIPNHKAGKIRILATSGRQRSPFTPEVATFAEQGFNEFIVEEWFGFYAPPKTPSLLVGRANTAINAALKEKSVVDSLATVGLIARGSTPQEMAASAKTELDRWGPLVKRVGFTSDS